jgi:hypothetical protein
VLPWSLEFASAFPVQLSEQHPVSAPRLDQPEPDRQEQRQAVALVPYLA